MERVAILLVACLAVLSGVATACAGPCTAEIAQVEQQIAALQAAQAPAGEGEPSTQQTIAAQLHHQPTPSSVQSGLRQANAEGEAALDRARQADVNGDAAACTEALRQARHLYDID